MNVPKKSGVSLSGCCKSKSTLISKLGMWGCQPPMGLLFFTYQNCLCTIPSCIFGITYGVLAVLFYARSHVNNGLGSLGRLEVCTASALGIGHMEISV